MRQIAWIKAARKEFEAFPVEGRKKIENALTMAARGSMSDIAKPMRGFDVGVFEIALAHRSDAYRVVYAIKLGTRLWVVHAFQKKSTKGVKTPRHEIELIHARLKYIRSLPP